MAVDPQVQALTQAQQQAQYANSQLVAVIVAAYFQSLGEQDYDSQIANLLTEVIPLLAARRADSASLAAQFYSDVRQLMVPSVAEAFEIHSGAELNLDQVRHSLISTGPFALKKALAEPDVDRAEALANAAEAVGQASQRHVADGGRLTIIQTAQEDPVSLGYVRILNSTDPCFFCTMLVSRGPVYKDDSFDLSDPRFIGPGDAKVHDHCHCTMRAVYSRSTDIPDDVKTYEDMWTAGLKYQAERAKAGEHITAAVAYRRVFEGRADTAA